MVPKALQPPDPGADLFLPDERLVDGGTFAVRRLVVHRDAKAVVERHDRVDELAGQHLDLDTISECRKVSHRLFP